MDLLDILDPLIDITLKYLLIHDILNITSLCKNIHIPYNHNELWIYLLLRDYNITHHVSDPKQVYIKNYRYRLANLYEISLEWVVIPELLSEITDDHITTILQHVPSIIKRGDIVHIKEYGDYRDDGLLIYNGTTLEHLSKNIDDNYMRIPSSYHIGDEFKATHWINIPLINSYISIDINKYMCDIISNKVYQEYGMVKSHFHGDLGTFSIIFNPHIDSALTSERVYNLFILYTSFHNVDPVFDWLGSNTLYGENDDPHILYYIT